MRYKRFSRVVWTFSIPKFRQVFKENEFFNSHACFRQEPTRTLENEILPLLRKQKGFKDEITLSNPGSLDATAISLWENKASAEAYNTNTYPAVLRTLTRFIDGTPKVQTCEAVTSTFHNALVAV